jgi:hypothetical protein
LLLAVPCVCAGESHAINLFEVINIQQSQFISTFRKINKIYYAVKSKKVKIPERGRGGP